MPGFNRTRFLCISLGKSRFLYSIIINFMTIVIKTVFCQHFKFKLKRNKDVITKIN